MPSIEQDYAVAQRGSVVEVLGAATRLGLTSFGGPIAHLGYFRDEYVVKRKWLDAQTYADLVALCQFLPGPASSQVGIAVGIFRAGLLGGLAAWLGFTLPSALALVGLPLLRHLAPSPSLAVFDSFFRVGSLVFGGGHVVLPLIQAEVVPPGWITNEQFIAG